LCSAYNFAEVHQFPRNLVMEFSEYLQWGRMAHGPVFCATLYLYFLQSNKVIYFWQHWWLTSMIRWIHGFTSTERKRSVELKELLWLTWVSFTNKKCRLWCFEHVMLIGLSVVQLEADGTNWRPGLIFNPKIWNVWLVQIECTCSEQTEKKIKWVCNPFSDENGHYGMNIMYNVCLTAAWHYQRPVWCTWPCSNYKLLLSQGFFHLLCPLLLVSGFDQ